MPLLTLNEIAAGLYEIVASSPGDGTGSPARGAVSTYYLTQHKLPCHTPVTLDTIWSDTRLIGAYLFIGGAIPPGSAADFARKARAILLWPTSGYYNARTLFWLDQPDPGQVRAALPLYQPGNVNFRTVIERQDGTGYRFDWSPLTLAIGAGPVKVSVDSATQNFVLTTVYGDNSAIGLAIEGHSGWYQWNKDDGDAWVIALALAGNSAGAFKTRLSCDFAVLIQYLGCEIRYAMGSSAGMAVAQLSFPIYSLAASPQTMVGFILRLHPLLPVDPLHTRFEFDLSNGPPGRTSPFLTTTGGGITIEPAAASPAGLAPGFAFCISARTEAAPADPPLYLAPAGLYTIQAIDSAAGTPEAGMCQWMCGLSGLEYLELQVGDCIAFQTSMPAYMSTTSPVLAQDLRQALNAHCTSAWVSYPAGGPARRYFGQPGASVYFGSALDGACAHPLRALLASVAQPAVFPLAPYGLCSAANGPQYAALESGALTGVRNTRLTAASAGPVFLPAPASMASSGVPLPATAETKQGFVVSIRTDAAAAGTWRSIDFARSPGSPATSLALDGLGTPATKAIATQLMRDELFLVVSDATQLGAFSNELTLAGFSFLLDLGSQGTVDGNSTILIFKYNTCLTLQELACNPALWAAPDLFVRDAAGTAEQITAAFTAADRQQGSPGSAAGGPDDPFEHFRRIATDPAWTGMIALNCAIDGNAMPADLQMLLGGIDGQLRAHHLGLQGNRLDHTAGMASIAASSLFGVISYQSSAQPAPSPDKEDDFAYELELLTVVFLNSAIVDFKARVGLTINRLFGRAVTLMPGPASPLSPAGRANTLQINGHYQLEDGVAKVTFVSNHAFLYAFPAPVGSARVLRQVAFDRAALAPVSEPASASPASASPGAPPVRARFSLSGALWFRAEPFDGAPGLDLFSFGAEPAAKMENGLALSGLAIDIGFNLNEAGAVTGPRSVHGNLSAFALTSSQQAIRPNSLLAALPLQLSACIIAEAGFTASSRGAAPVHVLQLEPSAPVPAFPVPGSPGPIGSPAPAAPAAAPYVTVAPQYALEMDMPLGSLGSLSNASVGLMAKLIIGWGASRLVPDSDAAAVMVQLPQAFAGYGAFQLQGILKTVFGDANLLQVELANGASTYALLFNNVQLSVLGYNFPSGMVIDFLIFAGGAASSPPVAQNTGNLAWFLGASATSASPA